MVEGSCTASPSDLTYTVDQMSAPIEHSQEIQRQFGLYLKTQREQKSLSVQDASKTLRISEGNINAMENGHFSKLPQVPFVLGLMRSYGKFIGCDTVQLQQKIQGLQPTLQPHVPLEKVGKPHDPQLVDVHKPSFYVTQKLVYTLLAIVGLAIALWISLDVFSPQITRFMNGFTSSKTEMPQKPKPHKPSQLLLESQDITFLSEGPNVVKIIKIDETGHKHLLQRITLRHQEPLSIKMSDPDATVWAWRPSHLILTVGKNQKAPVWKDQVGAFKIAQQ
jgi:cytoskeletal protein RodZ